MRITIANWVVRIGVWEEDIQLKTKGGEDLGYVGITLKINAYSVIFLIYVINYIVILFNSLIINSLFPHVNFFLLFLT